MAQDLLTFLRTETAHLEQAGLLKSDLVVDGRERATLTLNGRTLVNMATNDYLGLAGHPALAKAAKAAIDRYGVGSGAERLLASQPVHQELEAALSGLCGTDAAVAFASGYHANSGLFEALLADRDTIFCDELVHPSCADGIRASRARVAPYRHNDLNDLEDRLKRSRSARFRAVVTDAVGAFDGRLAPLAEIRMLASQYDALLIVDDSHGLGVLGANAHGTAERLRLEGEIDVVTGSLGHAVGSSGGFVAGRREVIEWLRQKSRPYLVSSALAPAAAAAALAGTKLIGESGALVERLRRNTTTLRSRLTDLGLDVIEAEHPIIAVRVGSAVAAQRSSDFLLQQGIYTLGLCHPVVPEGAARIRLQVSAAHTGEAIDNVVAAFIKAKGKLGALRRG